MGLSCKAGQGPCRLTKIFIYLFIFSRKVGCSHLHFPPEQCYAVTAEPGTASVHTGSPPAPGTLPPSVCEPSSRARGFLCGNSSRKISCFNSRWLYFHKRQHSDIWKINRRVELGGAKTAGFQEIQQNMTVTVL